MEPTSEEVQAFTSAATEYLFSTKDDDVPVKEARDATTLFGLRAVLPLFQERLLKETRAQAFEDAAKEMDRLVGIMKEQQQRILFEDQRDWASSYIADREGHAVWLRKWAEREMNDG